MKEITDRIEYNKQQCSELFQIYSDHIIMDKHFYYHTDSIKYLLKKYKEFLKDCKAENAVLKKLDKNIDNIRKEDLEKILFKIDDNHYKMFRLYVDQARIYFFRYLCGEQFTLDRNKYPMFKDNHEINDEVKGLFLTREDIDTYFAKAEHYNRVKESLKVLDCGDDLSFYGVYPKYKGGRVIGARIVVPPVHNLETSLINVHEIRHGLDVMKKRGKKWDESFDYEGRAKKQERRFVSKYLRNK